MSVNRPDNTGISAAKTLAGIVGMTGAGVTLLAILVLPSVFHPWPFAALFMLLAGLAGIAGALVANGVQSYLPLVLPLPLCRLLLLIVRHGLPPWPLAEGQWLTGDNFVWWAGAFFIAGRYASILTHHYLRIQPRWIVQRSETGAVVADAGGKRRGTADRGLPARIVTLIFAPFASFLTSLSAFHPDQSLPPAGDERPFAAGPDYAQEHYRAAIRWVWTPAVLGAFLLTIGGARNEGCLALSLGALYLVLGLYYLGMAFARRMDAQWAEQGVAAVPETGMRWWEGYGRYLFLLLLLLPLLPGGFHPLGLNWLFNLFGRNFQGGSPNHGSFTQDNIPIGAEIGDPALIAGPPSGITAVIFNIIGTVLFIVPLAVMAGVCSLVLWEAFKVLGRWARQIKPLWRMLTGIGLVVRRLFSSLRDLGSLLVHPESGGFDESTPDNSKPPRYRWPASAVRALFARLVIRGREQGLKLPSALTPAEIGRQLEAGMDSHRDDLAVLVEGYEEERYGERKLRGEKRKQYRDAWRKVWAAAGRPAGDTGAGDGGPDPKGG